MRVLSPKIAAAKAASLPEPIDIKLLTRFCENKHVTLESINITIIDQILIPTTTLQLETHTMRKIGSNLVISRIPQPEPAVNRRLTGEYVAVVVGS